MVAIVSAFLPSWASEVDLCVLLTKGGSLSHTIRKIEDIPFCQRNLLYRGHVLLVPLVLLVELSLVKFGGLLEKPFCEGQVLALDSCALLSSGREVETSPSLLLRFPAVARLPTVTLWRGYPFSRRYLREVLEKLLVLALDAGVASYSQR